MKIILFVILIVLIITFINKYEIIESFEKDPIVRNFNYMDGLLVKFTNTLRKTNRDIFKTVYYSFKKKK